MKRILSLLLTVVLVFGCLAVLSSCAPEDAGAEINIYLGSQVYDLDPTDYYVDSNAEQVMSLLFEPLFSINEKGKLECAAAKKYTVDREERKITIELRESYWSDGKRVTAADFIYAWSERLLNPNNPNPAAALLYDIENAAAIKSASGDYRINDLGVEATGVYELVITYRRGADYETLLRNLASVATAPVRQDLVSVAETYWSKALNTIATNGPFAVKSLNYDDGEFTLERNYGYHQLPTEEDFDNNVVPAELHATFTVAGEAVSVSYEDIENKARFLMTDAPLSDRAAKKDSAKTVDDTSVYTYVFNTNNPLFANEKVRQALSLAIDRNAIVDAITFGKAANGFLPDVSGGFYDGISGSADLDAARELLAEVEDLEELGTSFTLTVNDDEESLRIASIVKAAWETLGFDVAVEALGEVVSTISSGEIIDSGIQVAVKEAAYGNYTYDVIAVDWQTYSADPFVGLSAFSTALCGCGTVGSSGERRVNISGWSNKDYDYLLNAALKSEGDSRAEALKEAEKILVESAPIVPLVFNQSVAFVGSELDELCSDALGNWVFSELELANYHNYPGSNSQAVDLEGE